MANPESVLYTNEEVAKHDSEGDCWVVWKDRVYNVTSYVRSHPGGKRLLKAAGRNCEEFTNKFHPWLDVHKIVGRLQVGVLASSVLE